jgi:hypothetical protein
LALAQFGYMHQVLPLMRLNHDQAT